MANNRLYLEDSATGDKILLCKSLGDGWYMWTPEKKLNDWLQGRDMGASYGTATGQTTLQLRTENEGTTDERR